MTAIQRSSNILSDKLYFEINTVRLSAAPIAPRWICQPFRRLRMPLHRCARNKLEIQLLTHPILPSGAAVLWRAGARHPRVRPSSATAGICASPARGALPSHYRQAQIFLAKITGKSPADNAVVPRRGFLSL